jgi:DNA polymerase-1
VPAMERANPRVHTSFRQAEARTSRMSSAQPNMQNLPRPDEDADPEVNEMALGIRRVIVPEPGNALLVLDYASIEVMVMAHYIADAGLTAELEAGKDLYSLNASRVYVEPYDVVHKGGAKSHLRQRSKVVVLQCMYGGGAQLLATRLGCSTMEAAKIKADTLDAIPGYWAFNDRVQRAAANRGRRTGLCSVETILGRRLAVPRDKLYVALNTVVQGTSAEIMKLGLVAAAPVMQAYGFKPLLVVHDELVAEGPACAAEECLLKSKEAMENVYPLRPALKVSGDWSTESYAHAK